MLNPYPYGVQYAADGRKLRSGRMIPVQGLDAGDDTVIGVNTTRGGDFHPIKDDNSIAVEMEIAMPFENPTDYVGNLVYKNGVLDKILVDGGFITAEDGRYHFFVTDHLGNVRVVVNENGDVEQVNQYYPYGKTADMNEFVDVDEFEDDNVHVYEPVLESVDNPYKWGGKEWDADQGAYDFGARMYAPADARWSTMDPLCEKYYHISPYAYCAGNPVNLVDPDGRDLYHFDENGNYLYKDEREGENRAVVHNGNSVRFYDFSDPQNDPKDIEQGVISGIEFVSESTVIEMLSSQRTFDSNLGVSSFVKASNSSSLNDSYSYDYSSSVLPCYYSVNERETGSGKELYSNRLFLAEGDSYLHNYMNFGNYLWGASGCAFGIPLFVLRTGAHMNSLGLFSPGNRSINGYSPQFDSKDDQLSISQGYNHAKRNGYRRLRK